MKHWIIAIVTLSCLLVNSIGWAETEEFNAAQQLIQNWFTAMEANNVEQASAFLAPEFVSIHTDGIVRNKQQEIDLIKNLHMKKFHLSDFQFSKSNDVIIVTYRNKGKEQIDNKKIKNKAAGRMAVLQKQGEQWLIVAYANLDKIR